MTGQPILIGIGANLPGADGAGPLETCRRAAIALDRLPGLRLSGLSRWFRFAPIPAATQPDFVNGVAHQEGSFVRRQSRCNLKLAHSAFEAVWRAGR